VKKAFFRDCMFEAVINPVGYKDGVAVFIDTEYDTWNISQEALEKAFEL
jgi:dTDP-4-amino-4,6-dideoxygalactose transaminase